eukprot:TRINITY_DN544_c0_g1_i1.p1 TRINITY_DN544_c0_g1~~TRINITY_DN544_c0_g1_i1.p1  ORF type:complete len:213 (-),score=49.83 TRINITY_DN544_c0_g1_i1:86-640(-)
MPPKGTRKAKAAAATESPSKASPSKAASETKADPVPAKAKPERKPRKAAPEVEDHEIGIALHKPKRTVKKVEAKDTKKPVKKALKKPKKNAALRDTAAEKKKQALKDRPKLRKGITAQELQNYYWVEELKKFLEDEKIPHTGTKKVLIKRVLDHLNEGTVKHPPPRNVVGDDGKLHRLSSATQL